MERLKGFLVLSVLALILINVTFVSAYIIYVQYGAFKLNPGEDYNVNIPFFGAGGSENPIICGKAETTSGEALAGINVSVYYKNDTFLNKSTTNSQGVYCINLPKIISSKDYKIFVEYNNQTPNGNIQLASNDYTLNMDNYLVFSKTNNRYVTLQGTIDNEDAEVDNGRVEVNLQYFPINVSDRYEIFDYQKYFVNIEPGESYDVPSDEINVSWEIPLDAKLGRYKFYVKTSFNAKERTKDVYFNLTA